MPVSDALPFFRAWISNPLRVAAVAPSSSAVASLMTQEITPRTGPVLELGPGTGPFTQALLERGVPEQNITLVEYDVTFARLLGRRFPLARVFRMDAAELATTNLYVGAPVGAVVSGLGILAMPLDKASAILTGAFACMAPGGAFYQITYGPRCPVRREILDGLDLEAERTGWTLRNLPPASVYRIRRRRSLLPSGL
ncbi:SAM-dependent methyltransferase [Labrys neptuniae]|uniref:class I SAM-dependent methyltransferase n=1 Tax=Labrys neptuniae TaxID=376174 RepID=UPI0028912F71|nr:SAM-dependent methyltransferase [Labrys neptuniae]MDT3377455.1 SAM-dependent methyltransferase [Labrys neptuniae]